jgi:hypothetical protein
MFNIDDILKIIFTGEVPPHEMFKLLTEKWELSERFALALISCYGGNIYKTYLAIKELQQMRDDFRPFGTTSSANLGNCFDECKNDSKAALIVILKQLGENGFAPLKKRNDPLAEILSRNNIAGVVTNDAITIGLSKSVWTDGTEFGLVPSGQTMRLMIAKYLVVNKLLTSADLSMSTTAVDISAVRTNPVNNIKNLLATLTKTILKRFR